jgi:hypothetical protein
VALALVLLVGAAALALLTGGSWSAFTRLPPRLLRAGAIDLERLREVVPELEDVAA